LGCVALAEAGKSDPDTNRKAVEVANILFAAGAKLGRYDNGILFFPVASGNAELVRLLIDHGASITEKLEGYTAAELAKKYGHEAVYLLVVSRGGTPVDSKSSAQLALIEAADNRDIDGMGRALESGARINEADANEQTALIAAVRWPAYTQSDAFAIWWLLDHGADPNRRGADGDQPLHSFVAASKYPDTRPDLKQLAELTLARLLEAGAKVSGLDNDDRTPLHIVAKYDNVRAAEILIEQGAKLMPRDKFGKTPLDYAESGTMIRLLKSRGATEQ
jgi:ankyrin repeat protein